MNIAYDYVKYIFYKNLRLFSGTYLETDYKELLLGVGVWKSKYYCLLYPQPVIWHSTISSDINLPEFQIASFNINEMHALKFNNII